MVHAVDPEHLPGALRRAPCRQTEFGKPLVDSTFTLTLVTGQSEVDVSQHVFANLGWDRVRCANPLFEGDTVYSQ
jgi:itaconyl-CoA hydratase